MPAAEIAPSVPDARDDFLEATYSKVFLRIVPFLMVLWVIAWIDRVNVGFAKLQMLHDLNFSEAVYGLGAGIFFLGYFLFEVPNNLLMMRIEAKKTIARITLGWGLTSMAMVFERRRRAGGGLGARRDRARSVPPARTGSAMGLSATRPAASRKRDVHNWRLEGEPHTEFS